MIMLTQYTDDTAALRRAFAGFPSGIAAVAAVVDDRPAVLVASSFTVGVSEDPPLVLFAVRKASQTWQALLPAAVLGISVLGEQLARSVRQLAGSNTSARLAGVQTTAVDSGAVFLDHSTIWLECVVHDIHGAGDHDIVVLRVLALKSDFDRSPLIWHRSGFTTLVSSGTD